jgi:hypothetical protein
MEIFMLTGALYLEQLATKDCEAFLTLPIIIRALLKLLRCYLPVSNQKQDAFLPSPP